MEYAIGFILVLVVLIVACEIRYRNNQVSKIQGKEDQQRYGSKPSAGKIVSYKKIGKWWVKK